MYQYIFSLQFNALRILTFQSHKREVSEALKIPDFFQGRHMPFIISWISVDSLIQGSEADVDILSPNFVFSFSDL